VYTQNSGQRLRGGRCCIMEAVKTKRAILIVAGLFILIGFYHGVDVDKASNSTQNQPAESRAFVTYVFDGDTVQARPVDNTFFDGSTSSTAVRLIGVDTPEINWGDNTEECFGSQARSFLKSALLNERVTIIADSEQPDRGDHGRLLAYVLRDGVNINKQLIAEGYGKEASVGPGYTKQDSFLAAQRSARENNRGLWSFCQS